MQNERKFWVNCIPPRSTHQSALRIFKMKGSNGKEGRQFIGRDNKGRAVDKELQLLMLPFRPPMPLDCPIELEVKWIYPFRKSEPQKNRIGLIPCIARPDADNLLKGLVDAMTKAGFWVDDSRIYRMAIAKWYGESAGIGVRIATLSS